MPNWNDVLQEIAKEQNIHSQQSQTAADRVRHSYLKKLHNKTGRNIIAYYSGFLSKPNIDSSINDEDKNGFMMAIHNLDRQKGLDLILHTPGGNIAATESIVHYLHKMFNHDMRAIIPQISMSAGTMLACSCKEILMAKHSNLGPIDPHLAGIPAHGVIEECRAIGLNVLEIEKDKQLQDLILTVHHTYMHSLMNSPAFKIIENQNGVAFIKQQQQQIMQIRQ